MVGGWVKLKYSLERPDYIALHDVTAACEMFQSAPRSRDRDDLGLATTPVLSEGEREFK